MESEEQEVRRRLKILFEDEKMADEYLRRFGPNMDIKNIKRVKEEYRSIQQEEELEGKDPIYETTLQCPVCKQEPITSYELRAKTQQMTYNKFYVPIYEGVMDYRTVKYERIAVAVCSNCFFASPDSKDFLRPSAKNIKDRQTKVPTNVLLKLQEHADERKSLLKGISDPFSFFKRPRSIEASVLSYRLALVRAAVEAEFELPYTQYKMGAYCLKIAHIQWDTGANNEETLTEALKHFSEAFRLSESASEDIEYQIIYTVAALNMRMGDFQEAAKYIAVLDKIRSEIKTKAKEDARITTACIDKWTERTKNLWEDRDEPDLFKGT